MGTYFNSNLKVASCACSFLWGMLCVGIIVRETTDPLALALFGGTINAAALYALILALNWLFRYLDPR